jgi:peroxiredoxin Q/BCP
MPEFGVGERAPEFRGTTTEHRTVSLETFRGRVLVLFFYPKAFTPSASQDALAFRDHHEALQDLGAEVIGVSVDDPLVQVAFARQHHLEYELVGDRERTIAGPFGVMRGSLPGTKRVTFVVDEVGTIVQRLDAKNAHHAEAALTFLQARRPPRAGARR